MNRLLAMGVAITSLFVSSCAYFQDYKESAQAKMTVFENKVSTRYQSLPPFHQISVNGPVALRLNSTTSRRYSLEMTDNADTLSRLFAKVENDTLFINFNPNSKFYFSPPVLRITSGPLRSLQYDGGNYVVGTIASDNELSVDINKASRVYLSGRNIELTHLRVNNTNNLTIKGINTDGLTVEAKDTRSVSLYGVMRLNRLQTHNVGMVQIGWVNAREVVIRNSDSGNIYLAGNTTLLNTETSGNVHLNLKYLRAQRAFINTAGNAQTDVLVDNSLSAFASDNSNIYYYKQPKLISKYMRNHGAVLFMRIPIPPCTVPICKPVPDLPG